VSETASAVADYLANRPAEQARGSLAIAAGSNPDAEAEYRRLAKEAGLPIDSVRDNKDAVRAQLSMPDVGELSRQFPRTTKYLSTLENARIAHDDVDTLTAIERGVRDFFGGAPRERKPFLRAMDSAGYSAEVQRAIRENPGWDADIARRMVGDGAIIDNQAQFIGANRGPAPTAGNMARGVFNLERARRSIFGGVAMMRESIGINADAELERAAVAGARSANLTPEFETATGRGLYGIPVSLIDNAPGIALSVATGNPLPGLAMAGAQSAGGAYPKYRERGGSVGASAAGAVLEGGIEVATELLPMRFLVDRLGKAGATEMIKGILARDLPTEQIATIAQDAVDTAIANPDKTWGQYIAERPGRAYETLLTSLGQAGTMGVISKAAQKIAAPNAKVEEAEQAAGMAQGLVQLAAQSKLAKRDPEAFREFLSGLEESDAGAPAELYVDAQQLVNMLNQSAITTEQLAAFAPAAAAQLDAARFIPGADIRIPLVEFAAAPTNLITPLIDHMRIGEDAMSRAEAQAYLKDEGPRIQKDVDDVLGQEQQRAARTEALESIRTRYEQDLAATGKFRPEANKVLSSIPASFYATQAERAGMSVEDFMEKYRLVIGKPKASQSGRQELQQADEGKQREAIELRKQESLVRSLIECLGGA
jgi:hypothetical protein